MRHLVIKFRVKGNLCVIVVTSLFEAVIHMAAFFVKFFSLCRPALDPPPDG